MNANPLVSVIIPTYNRADILGSAIDSVLTQTYDRTEIIVINDGSTDNTEDLLRLYGNRLRVITQSNAGPAVARNRGIAAAQGELIAFLDSDDRWLPAKLSRQVKLLANLGPSVACCICNATVQYSDGTTNSTFDIADVKPNCPEGLWLNPAEVLASRFLLFNQVVLIRRSALERAGHFDERLKFYEDYEFPLRLSLQGPWGIIRESMVVYHVGSSGSWARKALQQPVRLHADLVSMRKRILSLMQADLTHARAAVVLERELNRARRELFISRLSESQIPGAISISRACRRLEWIRHAAFRRTRSYPRIVVQQIG
jgi:glycosyltransferase involved in cell wall biosynthesis